MTKIRSAIITFALLATLGSISPALSQQIVVPPQFANQNDIYSQSILNCTDLPNGGADRDRTDDLMNAIHALSQLSYGPTDAY